MIDKINLSKSAKCIPCQISHYNTLGNPQYKAAYFKGLEMLTFDYQTLPGHDLTNHNLCSIEMYTISTFNFFCCFKHCYIIINVHLRTLSDKQNYMYVHNFILDDVGCSV